MDSESRKALGLLLDAINKEQIAQNDRIAKLEEQNKALQDHVNTIVDGSMSKLIDVLEPNEAFIKTAKKRIEGR